MIFNVCLNEASTNTPVDPLKGAGGRFAISTSWGIVAQLLTQLDQDASIEWPLARPFPLPLVRGLGAAITERQHARVTARGVMSRILWFGVGRKLTLLERASLYIPNFGGLADGGL